MSNSNALSTLLAAMTDAAHVAGADALTFFRSGQLTQARVDTKHGGSPVTEADLRVDVYLRERLGALVPEAGWLSEETADTSARLEKSAVFIVDPIDGTRAFVGGDPRWAVSIAYVVDGVPVLGVLHLPALQETFVAQAGRGATLNGVAAAVSARPTLDGGRFAGPKSLIDPMSGHLAKDGLNITREPKIPSLAYRFACVASGVLEAAVASTNAQDWDIAAADVILREAGGAVTNLQGQMPTYNLPDTSHGVLLAAPTRFQDQLNAALGHGRESVSGRVG